MKKLTKLNINSEKVMNNEELVILKGGYGECDCLCYDWEGNFLRIIGGDVTALTCNAECVTIAHGYGVWSC